MTKIKLKNKKIIEIGDSRGIIIPKPFFEDLIDPDKTVNVTIEQEK